MWEKRAPSFSDGHSDTDIDALRPPASQVSSVRRFARPFDSDALMDAVELAHLRLGQEDRDTLPPRADFEHIVHASGRPASVALTRFLTIDTIFLGLPIDDSGRLGAGADIVAIVELLVDPELAVWADWLHTLFAGSFYVLPTSTDRTCHVLFVSADPGELLEIVLALEPSDDGLLDVRIAYPSMDVYLADTFSVIAFDPERIAHDAALLEPLERRFFSGRTSLFSRDIDA